jgi:hypothetical protein
MISRTNFWVQIFLKKAIITRKQNTSSVFFVWRLVQNCMVIRLISIFEQSFGPSLPYILNTPKNYNFKIIFSFISANLHSTNVTRQPDTFDKSPDWSVAHPKGNNKIIYEQNKLMANVNSDDSNRLRFSVPRSNELARKK